MILPLSYLNVVDNAGVRKVMCLGIFKCSKTLGAKLGQIIIVSIKSVYTVKYHNKYDKSIANKVKFKKGMIRLGIIVRERRLFKRFSGIFLRFSDNALVLINKKQAPYSKRLSGPILYELCQLYKFIGTIARNII